MKWIKQNYFPLYLGHPHSQHSQQPSQGAHLASSASLHHAMAGLGIEDIEAAAREAAREAAAAAAATAGAGSAGGGDAGGGSNVDTLTAEQIDALLMRHDQVSLPKTRTFGLQFT